MNKAFFLDRDGVINADSHYVHKIEQFEFVPGVFEACRLIQAQGYKIIIVTNQSGIARGIYSEIDFQTLTTWMLKIFRENSIVISEVLYCPHHPTEGKGEYKTSCECRKPKPGMILKGAELHNIDLNESVLVGDRLSDIAAADNANIQHKYLIGTTTSDAECINCTNLQAAVKHFFLSESVINVYS
jgi:D-glycero-D-manno-heptose 1,7-bisphosphate phosphatase